MVEIYTFTKEECGVDFDTEVYLRINKNLFINVPEEDKYNIGKELDLMFDTLAELTDTFQVNTFQVKGMTRFPNFLKCAKRLERATLYM